MVRRPPAGPAGDVHTGAAGTAELSGSGDPAGIGAEPPPSAEQLIARAVESAGDPATAALVGRYWRFVADEELVRHSPEELLAVVVDHRELAGQRLPGEFTLRFTERDDQRRLGIDVVVDDLPFLVDSLTGALTMRGLDIQLLAHPLVVLSRGPHGELVRVTAEVEPTDAQADELVESWIHLEIDPVADPEARRRLESDLRRVLTDVRESVEDWPKMRATALRIADELAATAADGPRPPVPDKDLTDAVALLRWLADDHFTFLGYREYTLVDGPVDPQTGAPEKLLAATPGTGLGLLRGDQVRPHRISSMSPEARAKVFEKRLLIITKANSRATVHRPTHLDYIGLRRFGPDGQVVGERRFIGLFASSAYHSSVRDLPVVSRKVAEVMARSGLSPQSHSGSDLWEILESYPRDELFATATDDLYRAALGVLRMAGRRQLRVFLRRDDYGRFTSCLVYLPRDRFTTASRVRMQELLLRRLHGIGVDYTARVTESVLARVHFIIRTDPARPAVEVDPERLAAELAEVTRSWDGDFRLALTRQLGYAQAKRLRRRYADAFPEPYKDRYTPGEAVEDLAKLELLDEPGQSAMHLGEWRESTKLRFKVYRAGEPIMLSAVLPVLHSLGVRVTDEYPYQITREGDPVYLYDFGLALPPDTRPMAEARGRVENAFAAAWRGEAEVDGFNALVLRAGLSWRQVVVLRAYAKYLRQVGTVFSPEYLQATLGRYPTIAAQLVALFEARFDPEPADQPAARVQRTDALVADLERELAGVENLDEDRILRSYLALIRATTRTSFFQRGPDGRPKSYVSFKLAPQSLPELLPEPRPQYEIFVYAPEFEGVHLRFGPVARGGVRWSDRRDDFRTETLDLAKAQSVKNAVIVPAGAKGGFVLKEHTAPAAETARAEPPRSHPHRGELAAARYREFVSALLDITDNLVSGAVVPPPAVVRHDGDDPYLVVAADKGTATFSDLANEVAAGYEFWLGDAFAAGGSKGYDHKAMGITARGAWESVRRHFRELGVDVGRAEITAVGIGDMSGDVFGNGMLRSRRLKLVAAYDHRHIFLDPDPDPAAGYAERERLFARPRSSWDDYDRSLISEGGGVFPRTAKSVPVSPQVAAVLGLADPPAELTPVELIRAILRAPVDLLWNGGIGTYVKASTESHAEVRDKANDPVRVNGGELRARVVGEGGNLGFTQQARVEYARTGGLINTDFIDNAGGVGCSDREVNIKILLARAGLAGPERDALLVEMTDEVAELVLRENYQQAASLARARVQVAAILPVHRRMISDLSRAGVLDRRLWALPSDEELAERAAAGQGGLLTPELAVLLSHVKNLLKEEIGDSDLPDEAWTGPALADYFPTPVRQRFADALADHPLRRKIITQVLVNDAINRCGVSFVYRAVEETGASAADVLRAYQVIREVYGLGELWRALAALDDRAPVAGQTAALLAIRRLVDRAVRWLLQNRRSPLDVAAEIAALRPGVARLLPKLPDFLRGEERAALAEHEQVLVAQGVPAELAAEVTRVVYGFGLVDVVEVAREAGVDPADGALDHVASVYFKVSERFGVDAILSRISALPRQDRWQTLARMALRYDLYAALAALTSQVLAATADDAPAARLAEWERRNEASVARTRTAIREFEAAHSGPDARAGLAALSVLLRQIRTLVRTTR